MRKSVVKTKEDYSNHELITSLNIISFDQYGHDVEYVARNDY